MSERQSGILYDNLIKNSKDAILFLKGTKIIDANQRALDFFEVRREDFIGKEIYEFSQNEEQTQKRAEKRRKGIPEYYTATLQTSNSLKEAEVYAIPVDTENLTSISIIRDVTEYNRLDRKYRTIFERSADLIFVTNASGVVFINPSGLEYLGLDKEEEILGKSTLNFIHPDYRKIANKYAALRRAGGKPPHQYRSKMIRKDGTVLDVEFNASFIMWDGIPSSLTIVRDIGEQVRLEKELMESRELFSGFIESATDGFSIIDENMRYVMVNDTELKYSRRKREDIIGKHILEVFPDLDEARYEGYKKVLKTGEPIKFQDAMNLPERGLRLDFSAFKAGNFLGIIAKDITETRKTQDQLAYQANLLQNVSDAIISMDLKLNIISWNKAAERLYGYSEDEVIGENIEALLKNQYPNEKGDISSILLEKKEWSGEIKQLSRDGRQLNVLASITPILNDNGDRIGIVSVNRDITEQRQLELQLSGFIESATDGITILDEKMHYIMVNDAWLNLSGFKKGEVIGKHVLDLFPEIKNTERYQAYKNVLETGTPVNFPNALPINQGDKILDFSAFKIGKLLGIVVKDVTEQANYQRRLEALHNHASQLSLLETREDVAHWTMEVIRELLGMEIGTFGIVEQNKVVFREYKENSLTDELDINARGITLRAIRTGETQLVPDTRKDPDYIMGSTNRGVITLTELDVPIKIDEKVVAIINLESWELDAFSYEDRRLVETLAEHVSSALSRISYRSRLTAIHSFAVEISKHTKTDEIAEKTLRFIDNYFDYPYSSYGEVRENELVVKYHHGAGLKKDIILPLNGKGITVKAVNTGKTQFIEDTNMEPDYVPSGAYDLETGEEILTLSEIVVPIFEHEKVVGVINIESPRREKYSPDLIHLLELIGEHVSARLTALRLETEKVRADQAVEMERLKTRFVSTATHELRTPLTSIKGYLELALSEEIPERVREYLQVADRSTDRLEALTAELLDQQRIEEGRLSLNKETVDLNQLVSWVFEEVSGTVEKKNQKINIEFNEPTIITADELRLGQVLVNLLDNASKYSPEGTEITLQIEKTYETIIFTVKDQGIGLQQEDIKKLFTPFPDIDRPIVSEKSVGLGLSICRGIIELHGGKIWATSNGTNKGSTFHFTIPTKK